MAWVVESIRESLVCLTSLATRPRVSLTLVLVLEITDWLLLARMTGGPWPCSVWFIDPPRESTGFKLWNPRRSHFISNIFFLPNLRADFSELLQQFQTASRDLGAGVLRFIFTDGWWELLENLYPDESDEDHGGKTVRTDIVAEQHFLQETVEVSLQVAGVVPGVAGAGYKADLVLLTMSVEALGQVPH